MADGEDSKADKDKFVQQLLGEKEGLIPKGFAKRIEGDFTTGDIGIMRRLALAYLEMPFKESAEPILADRGSAVSLAHLYEVLDSQLEKYELLAEWLRAAKTRMQLAVALRDDKDSVIAEARRVTAGDSHHLRIIN